MPRTALNYHIFQNCQKGKKYYFRIRNIDANGNTSGWSNAAGAIAGDYTPPDPINPDDVSVVVMQRGILGYGVAASWDRPSDIFEIRWYRRRRLTTAPTSVWADVSSQSYTSTPIDGEYLIPGESNKSYVYDIFAVPVDISRNVPSSIIPCAVGVTQESVEYPTGQVLVNGETYDGGWVTSSALSVKISYESSSEKKLKYALKNPGSSEYGAWQEATMQSEA